MKKEVRYSVRVVASELDVTPDLIYSFFKDRKWPLDGDGMNEEQLKAIVRHVDVNKHRQRWSIETEERIKTRIAIQRIRNENRHAYGEEI